MIITYEENHKQFHANMLQPDIARSVLVLVVGVVEDLQL